jgi:hypothetical protein
VSKYKELGSVTSGRKTVIGQKISEYHTMLRNLDSTLLKRLRVSWVDCTLFTNIKECMHVILICTVTITAVITHNEDLSFIVTHLDKISSPFMQRDCLLLPCTIASH